MTKRFTVLSENNHFQHVETIKRSREGRNRFRKFFVEGVSAINLALKNSWAFDTIAYAKGRKLSSWATEILKKSRPKNCLELAPKLLEKLSDKEETSELLALVEMRNLTLSDVSPRDSGLVVVFDRPSSPGNLGSSIRTADAFGADAVVVSGHAVDVYDPLVIRSSVGTFFSCPVIRVESHKEVIKWLTETASNGFKYQVMGTSAKAQSTLGTNQPGTAPILVLMGNESSGLSRAYKEISDIMVSIPLMGASSSLNVTCALAIVLYDISQKRLMAP